MKHLILTVGAAVAVFGVAVPTQVSAAGGAAPATRVTAVTDACPLTAIPVLGPLLCSALGL